MTDAEPLNELYEAVTEKYAQAISYLLIYKRTKLPPDSIMGMAEQITLCEEAIGQLYYISHECEEVQERLLAYFDQLLVQLTSDLAARARERAWTPPLSPE